MEFAVSHCSIVAFAAIAVTFEVSANSFTRLADLVLAQIQQC